MRIAIIGTRGIPNHYGGFEQCAEYLAVGLVKRGHEVIVYSGHDHPYLEDDWNGVKIIHCYDPEDSMGTKGQFIYDFNCIWDVRKRNCDIILQLGYTSSSVWGWLLPRKNTVITTNMDGLEWMRTKFPLRVRKFLKFAEKLGAKYSDHLIADSIGIQKYLQTTYGRNSTYIPYGADEFENNNTFVLKEYNVTPYSYDMLIARLEPENSIEVILDGVVEAKINRVFLVVGKCDTPYGRLLTEKYKNCSRIIFVGGIYIMEKLNNLRYYSNLYFHGHTVGGTNPSLLEAMASGSLICANENPFNQYILEKNALYFTKASEITYYLETVVQSEDKYRLMVSKNKKKVKEVFSWDTIIDQYDNHFKSIVKGGKRR